MKNEEESNFIGQVVDSQVLTCTSGKDGLRL